MNKIKILKDRLQECDEMLEKTFEEYVKEQLLTAEEISYSPYENKTKEELQMRFMENIVDDYKTCQEYYLQLAHETNKILRKELSKIDTFEEEGEDEISIMIRRKNIAINIRAKDIDYFSYKEFFGIKDVNQFEKDGDIWG